MPHTKGMRRTVASQNGRVCTATHSGTLIAPAPTCEPRTRGKLVGQKTPLKLKELWAIRVRLQLSKNLRDLALYDLAIDSELRGCDLVKLLVRDVAHGDQVASRAMEQKIQRAVHFEITEQTRDALKTGLARRSFVPRASCF